LIIKLFFSDESILPQWNSFVKAKDPIWSLTAAPIRGMIGTGVSTFEDQMEQVLLVFSRCNALMLMLGAIVAYRAMDRYGLYALGRRRVL